MIQNATRLRVKQNTNSSTALGNNNRQSPRTNNIITPPVNIKEILEALSRFKRFKS